MLKICLSRVGKKKQPSYRVIVLEKNKDPWGDYLELLGNYNPRTTPSTIKLNAERIKYWISKGAQPTATVHNLLVDQKVIEGDKVVASSGKVRKGKKDKEEKPAAEDDKPAEEKKEEPAEDAKPDEAPAAEKKKKEVKTDEAPKATEEKPADDAKKEAPKKEDKPAEEKPAEPAKEEEKK